MRNKILFALVPIFLLTCNFLFPIHQQDETPHPTPLEAVPAQPTFSTPQPLIASTEPFFIIRINKTNGGLMAQLTAEAEKANALGLAPFIEFDAI